MQGLDPASAATLLGNVRASAINMLQSNPDLPEAQRRDRAVVIHIMDGTLAGNDSWFANPMAKVAAHEAK